MEKQRSKSKLNPAECKLSVLNFFLEQKRFKQNQAEFTDVKERFYSDMENYFDENHIGNKLYVNDVPSFETLVVSRVQSSKVEFDLVKLEKALGKEIAKSVIIKRYEITDIEGLIAYLKECGVDPKIFKSFLSISRSLDAKELDRLADLGEISKDQIENCYTIRKQKPYFTVSVGRGQSDEEEE